MDTTVILEALQALVRETVRETLIQLQQEQVASSLDPAPLPSFMHDATLGKRMKEAARRAGKTGEQIAAEIGVNVVSLRRWWGDRRQPTWANIMAYAKAVNTTPEALEGGG
jgi:DNA-binding XRE family transcriptional regulator